MKKYYFIILFIINLAASAQYAINANDYKFNVLDSNYDARKNISLNETSFFQIQSIMSSEIKTHRLDSVIYSNWDKDSSNWIYDGKHILTYDENENLIQDFYENTSQLIANYKIHYKYDNTGNRAQYLITIWNENDSIWHNYYKEEYSYDDKNNQIQTIEYNWIKTINEWSLGYKHEFSYNEFGEKSQYVRYFWQTIPEEWNAIYKEEYFFNANNFQSEYITYNWAPILKEWSNSIKVDFTYNTLELISQQDLFKWNGSDQWLISEKREYSYDADKYLTNMIYYFFDIVSSQLLYKTKDEYSYDSSGNKILELKFSWDKVSELWIVTKKIENTYDSYGNITQKLESYLDQTTNSWIKKYNSLFYYTDINLASEKINEIVGVKIYPNPFSEYLQIECNNSDEYILFELFDINGCKLLSQTIKNNEIIRLNTFERGLYIYNINNKIRGRLLKK